MSFDNDYEAPPCSIDEECDADQDQEDQEEYEAIEGRNIELDFGTLELFRTRTKYITFYRPMIDEDITYSITRNLTVKSVKNNFHLDHHQGVLKPNQDFKMAVTYKPTLPSLRDVEVYDYKDSDLETIRIFLTGVAIGPHCNLSVKKLVFYITPGSKLTERKVELSNESSATARFKIDHPSKDVFQAQPLEGVVKSKSYQYISVKFKPTKPGLYARKMFCLVWNSEPLVLNVIGLFATKASQLIMETLYFPGDSAHGFHAYLENNRKKFHLSDPYLDFGLVEHGKSQTLTTTLNNHFHDIIHVDWNIAKEGRTFKISPVSATVRPKSHFQFHVQFAPTENYNVFQENVIAQLQPSQDTDSIPFTCQLRMQGHSFPANQGWLGQVEILPEVVYWQPCAPGEIVCTTMALRNRSHLPVLYKLLPPKKTNITVKPMMGKFREWEIIVAQLQTEPTTVRTYIEKWEIIINGREDRLLCVYFHGETCLPSIEIGKKNRIMAGSIQDGTQKEIQVQIKNNSYYSICYQFELIPNTIIDIKPTYGVLPANQSSKLTLKITGTQCAPKRERFKCHMRIIDLNGATSGESHDQDVDVYTECSYSELCVGIKEASFDMLNDKEACPSMKDFGCLPFGRRIKVEFEAVNFGNTNIYFQTCQTGMETHDKHFRIKPCFGEIKPKDSKRFVINGIIARPGDQILHFGYYNRMVKDSPLVTGDPITLFTLMYFAEFPIIQIKDIAGHNFGSLFGKVHLFKEYLQISSINKYLNELQNDDSAKIELRFPEFEVQDKEFYINLALLNCSNFDTTLNFKRNKLCDCTLQEKSVGISERKMTFDCPHRECLSIDIQDTAFPAKSVRYLTIKIKYLLGGNTKLSYIAELSNNRTITLYFNLYGILPGQLKLSPYTKNFEFKLKRIHLGTKVAPIQTFWMYNNTKNLLNVEFDDADIKHMCNLEGFEVLNILNPIDQILPYDCKALLVRFHPIEARDYSVTIDGKYYIPEREEEYVSFQILIEGYGVLDMEDDPDDNCNDVPKVCLFNANFPVDLSLEYIEIKALPVWNKKRELIFIKNHARGKHIQYLWKTVKIDNAIEISAERPYGILQPKEIHPVVITINTFSEPIVGSFLLPCEIVNFTDEVKHTITAVKHKEAEERIDEFMMGEPRWAKRQINPIEVIPKPEILFAAVNINVKTIHTRDADQKMDRVTRLKQYPNQFLDNVHSSLLKKYYPMNKSLNYPEKDEGLPKVSLEQRAEICTVLEDILSNVLFGNQLKTLVETSIRSPMHNYKEFVMDDREMMERKLVEAPLSKEDIAHFRQKEIEKFFGQIKINEISSILQSLICESVLVIAQCHPPKYVDIDELTGRIERTLYTCKNKQCSCRNNKSQEN